MTIGLHEALPIKITNLSTVQAILTPGTKTRHTVYSFYCDIKGPLRIEISETGAEVGIILSDYRLTCKITGKNHLFLNRGANFDLTTNN